MIPVILCGGSGKRLYPLSRPSWPKQFLRINRRLTLFQETIERALFCAPRLQRLIVVTSRPSLELVRRQIVPYQTRADIHILTEPAARNTAPALCYGALYARRMWGNEILWSLPCDHVIAEEAPLKKTLSGALRAAEKDWLTVFGIYPRYAETGYGYIKAGAALDGIPDAYAVDSFTEKPDRATARKYVSDGRYLWNSGMLLFGTDNFLAQMFFHAPGILNTLKEMDGAPASLPDSLYANISPLAVDKAVLEKTDRLAVAPCAMQWADIGSWRSLLSLKIRRYLE